MNLGNARLFGLIFMFFGVLLGALSSHALKSILTPEKLQSFTLGVEYMIYHGIALLALSSWKQTSEKAIRIAIQLMIIGQVLFSGSIFLLTTQSLHHLPTGFLGPITPIGGALLLTAWGTLIRKTVVKTITSAK